MARAMLRWLVAAIVVVLVLVIPSYLIIRPRVAPRLARDIAPAVTVLPDGAGFTVQCANGQLTGSFGPNEASIACATSTPTPTDTLTATITPSETPTSTVSPTDSPSPLPTDTATPQSTSTATLVPSVWGGPMGWAVSFGTVNGTPAATLWNTQMRGGDNAYLAGGNPSTLVSRLTRGQKIAAYSYTNTSPTAPTPGAVSTPVDTLTTSALEAIDLALQTADGAIAEWIIYSDDGYLGTVADHITQLKLHTDLVHNFVRLNNAPRFLVMYVPTGQFLNQNLPANPILASYPDGMLVQSQSWEDQINGADPTYLATACGLVNLVRQDAPEHPVNVQLQAYSKSTGQVWTETKLEADMDALGATCAPQNENVWFNPASQSVFSNVLRHYRLGGP